MRSVSMTTNSRELISEICKKMSYTFSKSFLGMFPMKLAESVVPGLNTKTQIVLGLKCALQGDDYCYQETLSTEVWLKEVQE